MSPSATLFDPDAAAIVTAVADVPSMRERGIEAVRATMESLPHPADLPVMAKTQDLVAPGPLGDIPLRVHRPTVEDGGPVLLYFHGGGMCMGTNDSFSPLARLLAHGSGATVVAVEYHLAPEHPAPAQFEDAWAATVWVAEHAEELGVDPDRLVVLGDSAGGTLAAAVALAARVTSMHERLVLAWDGEQLTEYADLSQLATGPINDMVVDTDGRAYVTQLGFELFAGEAQKDSSLLVVEPDGSVSAATDLGPLSGANGIAVSQDGRRVVTAEAFANRITIFDRDEQGRLSDRRVFAETPHLPDGLCLDADGAVWVGMPGLGAGRVLDGGTFTHFVPVRADLGLSPACVLGGPDRRTLYITAGLEVMDWEKSRQGRAGTVWTAPAPVSAGESRP